LLKRYLYTAKALIKRDGLYSSLKIILIIIFGRLTSFFWLILGKLRKNKVIVIAFFPTGGLGDYIVSAKILEEIQSVCDCQFDVFVEKIKFGKAIYGERKNVKVVPYEKYEQIKCYYDAAIMVEHFVHVQHMNKKRIKKLSPELYQKFDYIRKNWSELYVNIPEQCWRERIQFERCKCLGLNRWTELRMGGAFEVSEQSVRISKNDSYLKRWENLGITDQQYITFNYGADRMQAVGQQIKIWKKEYYEKWISLLRMEKPEVLVIQIGNYDCEKIKGADKYLLGEDLELIKWILAGARLHVDCEGGLVHLATQLATKCVVIFGPTPIHMYGYEQNINLLSQKCNYCMGLHKNWAYECMKMEDCVICMNEIKPEMVLEACMRIID